MNRILVTGCTGNVSRQVVDQLAAAGARFRAMTRHPDAAGLPPQPAFVTSTCAELTGAAPRTFLEWATDHAAEFRT